MLLAKFAQACGTDFFAHLDEDLAIEPERAAFGEHEASRSRDVDAVLAFIIGCAPAVDALAFDDHPPRRQSGSP